VGIEAGVVAGDDGDVAGIQQSGGEGDGVGDLGVAGGSSEIGGDVGEAVEGTLGLDAGDFGEGGEAGVHVLAAFFKLLAHGLGDWLPRGSVRAAMAGNWVKLVMWLVICDWSLFMASMMGFGPPT